ncbi:MAG: ribosome maturation factor RimP [Candidatus Sericytochromatia bacterium]
MGVKDDLFVLAEPVIRDLGYDLVDLEYLKEGPRWVVRIYIFKPEGISLDDCKVVSDAVGEVLEGNDPVKTAYHLEVSSPGAERVLKHDREFKIFQGRLVKITTKEAVDGEYAHFGRLGPVSDQNVQVTDGEGQPMTFAKDNVKQIRLTLDPGVAAGS